FMESTGRLYGLKVNYWVDERKDFEKSTDAAAKHLKDLYEKFGDWNLALAAYNAGAGRIQRAIDKFNSEDYFELTGYKHLAEETKDYVPKYFALMKIHKNLLRYGFKFPEVEPLVYEKVDLNFPVNLQVLSKITGIEMNEIIELNPSLRRWVTPPNDTFTLKIPLGYKEKVELALKEYYPEELLQVKIYTPKKRERIVDIAKKYKISPSQITSFNGIKKQIVRAGFPVLIPVGSTKTLVTPDKLDEVTKNVVDRETGSIKTYVVKKGDTLFSIAKKHKTTVDTIKRVNNIKALKVGMTLEIPTKKYVSKTVKKDRNKNSKSKFLLHTVKKGDTIYKLANKYDTKPDYIIKINKTKTLIPGKTIKIPRSNI
ncbi:MAG: LysM peptidoglycan-binding domain-containing protein, partial [Deferribacterales bacterium]